VAVIGTRSFGLIASMLGTLMAGTVLMPIDPALPRLRWEVMLREAGARAILDVGGAYTAGQARTGGDPDLSVLKVDEATGAFVGQPPHEPVQPNPLPTPSPDDPAYLFFTSGSTGVPKGVLGCHKGLSHFLRWQRATFGIRPEDRASQLVGISFDVVLRDMFLPLVSGAMLCLPESADVLDPERLFSWLKHEQITVLNTIPSLARFWLASAPTNVSLPDMRWVFFAGEPLTDALVREWRNAVSNSGEVVNLYGPTETTLIKCFYHVPAEPDPGIQPAGQSMPQSQALVWTNRDQPCGIGEPGEIVLRTPFRTLGYVNASGPDQARFAQNPFQDSTADVLYYTGDLGRYRPDGMLEILGRLDDQVKIRGVRVEPGEVAAALASHQGVADCVVTARQDAQDEVFLAAYVVKRGSDGLTAGQLRSYLSARIPAALVPSAFMFLEHLPLTPNGKVDRGALPSPDPSRQEAQQQFVAPRSTLEETLSRIWTEVMDVERVGIHDDFFDLGGHSLLATRIISRVRDACKVELALRALFEAPTIAGMASAIEITEWVTTSPQRGAGEGRQDREDLEV
jgi:amino acid adenylation domain-containing protein